MNEVLHILWLIPALPLAGFVVLVLGRAMPRRTAGWIGTGSIAAAAAAALLIGRQFLADPPPAHHCTQVLWTWIAAPGFAASIAFRLDALSLTMTLVVTVVAFFIHLYSTRFMAEEEGYGRFFAYMNLFVASMLVLVLADNLLLLYLGWEGVGLCSYLLIGFWYKDPANGRAAMKAFIVTRVGDAAMAVGLFLLAVNLGTLDVQELMSRASLEWAPGAPLAVAAAALLLAGAVGKSAQLPLQTWLPDAMAGPTPVSALIHAATMVTAGVYLIARTHTLFELAPTVQALVAAVGAATLLLAGFSALTQHDIKRVLAYSTISQIGYMFLGLGVGAWGAALFHFVTHAFFKSLLFLAAGVLILGLHHEHNMFRMGGLRKVFPVTFWTFLIGAASLAALPLVTSGFYSKDLILYYAWASPKGGWALWAAGAGGAFLTALYTFRMVFLTFFGPRDAAHATQALHSREPRTMILPLVALAALSLAAGFIELPPTLGNWPLFSEFISTALPAPEEGAGHGTELTLQAVASAISLAGVLAAWLLYVRRPKVPARIARSALGAAMHRFWLGGWGFDWLYDRLLVRPFIYLAQAGRRDVMDLPYQGLAHVAELFHRLLRRTQTGQLRWYAMGLAFGAIVVIAIVVYS